MNLNNKRREIKKFEEIPSYELPDYINKIVTQTLLIISFLYMVAILNIIMHKF